MKKGLLLNLLVFVTLDTHAGWKEDIIQEARKAYHPLDITVVKNDSVAASAYYGFDGQRVEVYTGLLKSSRLTADALRMTICHEIGHLAGGVPRKNVPMDWEGPIDENGMSFLSSEGQADYYAGMECFKKITKDDSSVDRISQAGLKFLNLVYDFPISIETPDLSVTPELIRDSYPGRQCRLDTIVAGAKKLARPSCWFINI